jgi:hypothetical protein
MLRFRQSVIEFVRLFADDSSRHCRVDMLDQQAQNRGDQLLKQNLSPAQREQYERRNCFEVIGGVTGRRYRIRQGSQLNVEQLDDTGRRIRVLCFMPEGRLAVGDVMLAQKIALELFETEAIMIANKSPTLDRFLDLEPRGRY